MSKQFVLVRGLPGSGKSTYVRNTYPNHLHYEADMYFGQDGDYDFDASKLRTAHRWCISNFDYAIKRGNDVVISNTFTTMKEMSPYLKVAKENGYNIVVIELKTNYGSIHDVPEQTIANMKNRWQEIPSEMYDSKIVIEES